MAEAAVRAVLEELMNVSTETVAASMDLWADDATFIRPSGNPLSKEQYTTMATSGDITGWTSKSVSIEKIKVVGDMAFALHKAHQTFSYKGTANDDVSVFTTVLVKDGDAWKLAHQQRSTGQPPAGDEKK